MFELCMVKETTEGISSLCIVRVIWWEEQKGLCISPHCMSVNLWGGGGYRKGTLIMRLHAPSVSLHSPASQQEKDASDLWQAQQTRATQSFSTLWKSWLGAPVPPVWGSLGQACISISFELYMGHLGRSWKAGQTQSAKSLDGVTLHMIINLSRA